MPVPTIIQVKARYVRHTDDLLVDDEKNNSENGNPHSIAFIDTGDKWTYVNLSEPIGRKRVFKFDAWDDEIWVVRIVLTEEEQRQVREATLVEASLAAQKDVWELRNVMGRELLDGVKLVRNTYTWPRGQEQFNSLPVEDVLKRFDRIREADVAADQWRQVYSAWATNGGTVEDALTLVIEKAKKQVIEGPRYSGTTEDHMNDLRTWISRAERALERVNRMPTDANDLRYR